MLGTLATILIAMKTPFRVPARTDDERAAVAAGLRSPDASDLRRCQIVLASARGETARQIAATLGCSDQWVRDVVRAFNAEGLPGFQRRSRRPHTVHVAFDAAGCERLRELWHRSLREFGNPTSVWTPTLLADVAAEHGLTRERISHETIRNALTRLDINWQRAKEWIVSIGATANGGSWKPIGCLILHSGRAELGEIELGQQDRPNARLDRSDQPRLGDEGGQ